MNRLRLFSLIIIVILLVLSALCSTAYAITGNYTGDDTGYVGVVVLFSDLNRQQPIAYCTCVLISPTVVLTAGHATVNAVAASVCFDQGPISYSIQNGQITYSGNSAIYNGVPITYPDYLESKMVSKENGNKFLSTSDVGLIILDSPVEKITNFPALPIPGFADTLTSEANLKVIGYGVQYQIMPKNVGVENSWTGALSRNSAYVQLLSTNFQGSDKYLKCTANPSQGKGGVAFGDSGGPMLYNLGDKKVVLALSAYVNSANCNGVSYGTRIDDPEVLAWINTILISQE